MSPESTSLTEALDAATRRRKESDGHAAMNALLSPNPPIGCGRSS